MKKILYVFTVILVALLLTAASTQQASVTTSDIKYITASGASCNYIVTGTTGISSHGVCMNETGNPNLNSKYNYSGQCELTNNPKRKCAATARELKPKTKYFVKAYAKLADGTVLYGAEKNFTTLPLK